VDKDIKQKKEELTKQVISTYEHFTSKDVADLVVNKKWIANIVESIHSTMTQVTQSLTADVITLAERYEQTLGEYTSSVRDLESKVLSHLKEMGFEL
jgi:type I restriction enzyme M protein